MLFTIGHSTGTQEYFLYLLEAHDVHVLLDVRSVPYSRYANQFNKNDLAPFLESHSISYFSAGKPFGARRDDARLYPQGYLDFELTRQTPIFQRGMEHVIARLEASQNVALMCTEKNPIDCHRAIMVARGFELAGVEVQHILQDATLLDQQSLNAKLLDMYFPNHEQMSLFGEDNIDDMLRDAYRMQNQKIGYKPLDPSLNKED